MLKNWNRTKAKDDIRAKLKAKIYGIKIQKDQLKKGKDRGDDGLTAKLITFAHPIFVLLSLLHHSLQPL